MKRITRNDDINFNVDEIRGKGERYNITFYTTNNAVNIAKTDQNVNDGIIVLNGSDLMTLGEGVLNFRVDNIAQNSGYNDGVFNSSFTRTTDYYLQAGVIIPDGSDNQTVIGIVGQLQDALNAEITRSKTKDNQHDAAIVSAQTEIETLSDIVENNESVAARALSDLNVRVTANTTAISNTYTKTEVDTAINAAIENVPTGNIPTKTSDLENDSNFVVDANYHHTDNNFTTVEKNKLAGLNNYDDTALSNRVTANTTAISNTYTKTEVDSKFTDIRTNTVGLFDGYDAYITLETHYNESGDFNELQITDGYSGNNVVIPFTGGFMSSAGLEKNTIIVNVTTGDTVELKACAFNSLTIRVVSKSITLSLGDNGSNLQTGFYYFYLDWGNAVRLTSLTFPNTLTWENGDVPQLSEFNNGTGAWLIYIINNCAMVKRFK